MLLLPEDGCRILKHVGETTVFVMYGVSRKEMSIFWEVIISPILSNNLPMYTCLIANGFPDRAVSLYRSLDLAPNIVRHSAVLRHYEACESV